MVTQVALRLRKAPGDKLFQKSSQMFLQRAVQLRANMPIRVQLL